VWLQPRCVNRLLAKGERREERRMINLDNHHPEFLKGQSMKKILIILSLIIFISCSINKQETEYYPFWWEQDVEGQISSFGIGVNKEDNTSRFASQNDAYHRLPGKIAIYLNDYVSENCIEPGDTQIQKELDRIFRHYLKYFNSIEKPDIKLDQCEFKRIKIEGKNSIKYFTRIYVTQEFLHASFVEFLDTTDLYILPKLRSVLKECFEE
jgi:hypothetical protein